jgi:FMN reductase
LLVELGATVPGRGMYLVMPRIAELGQITAEWGEANAASLVPAITGRLAVTQKARA